MDIGARQIDKWHRQRGWLGIGYHYVIRRDGTVEIGRRVDAVGAHTRGYNNRSVGICLIGGVHETRMQGKWRAPEDNFTDAQYAALDDLLDKLEDQYPDAEIAGHNKFANKACPAFDWETWLTDRAAIKLEEIEQEITHDLNDGRAATLDDVEPVTRGDIQRQLLTFEVPKGKRLVGIEVVPIYA